MKKDAYYFPHFCNARHDRKIKRVIKELGVEGYGIYFMLLEVLREQQDFKYPIADIDLLSDEFSTSEAKIKSVLFKYDLFQIDDNKCFFSIKQIFHLQPYLEKSERARHAANIKWQRVKELNVFDDANALLEQSNGNASKVKESKVKESKEVNDLFPFENFWNLYPTKVAKSKCKPIYEKLSDSEKETISKTIGRFVSYKPFQDYSHPHPQTYLNQKRWEDVIPEVSTVKTPAQIGEDRMREAAIQSGLYNQQS